MKKSLIITICIIMLLFLVSCSNNDETSLKCLNCGETVALDTKFCPQCGETILDSSNDNNNDEQCSHSWNVATCIIPKTCSKCGETEGNALGHTTTTGVCDRCNVRQGWTQDEVRSLIKVYDIFVTDIDSADGVDMTISWENTSSKTIKYIYFSVEAYNAVHDKVYCEIRGYNVFIGSITGPLEPGYSNLIYDSNKDEYFIDGGWENCYYNSDIKYFDLTNIRIIYMDNTEIEIGKGWCDYSLSDVPQGVYYTWSDEYNGYEVNYRLKKTCTDTHISIPSTYNGDKVVSIANKGFSNLSSLITITLPNTIKYIGESAFASCTSLTSIELPENLTDIGESAFFGCDTLKSITITDRISIIKDWTFYGCDSLVNVNMPDGVTAIGQYAFSNCSSLTNITIPNSVTDIGYNAFHDTHIEIASIPASAIYDIKNDKLKKVVITSGDVIEGFRNCISLTSVIIPNGVTKIDYDAFEGCTSLESITIPNTVISIESDAFKNCDSLTTIDIPSNVTTIGHGAFECCDSLITAKISGDYLSIGSSAFSECPLLTEVSIFKGVESIGSMSFADCPSLKSVYISDSVQYISGYAFHGCMLLTIYCETNNELSGWDEDWNYVEYDYGYIYAPVVWGYTQEADTLKYSLSDDGTYYIVTGIGSYSNTNLVIPEAYKEKPIKEIGESAFEYNTSIKTVEIPNGIVKIGDSAFYSCKNIESINISDGVIDIGAWTFKDCSKLIEIVIPNSVASIGSCAFSGCNSLVSIVVDSNNTIYKSISGNLYSKDGKILIQYAIGKQELAFRVPETVTTINDYAFLLCENLSKVIILDNITTIGCDAFNGCVNLTIYCATSNKHAGWDTYWNYCFEHKNGTDYCTVIWNYNESIS
ncbi:MAG: leucine-rich repeat domain-containing protein [Clostridiales bacterium]|nr:leucine-rich repeat domain-containing protein [Clostridiales bacterium]